MTDLRPKLVGIAALISAAALIAAPHVIGEGTLRYVVEIFCVFAFAQSWNFLAGYVGLMSFGQQLFIGLGSYFVFMLSNKLGLNPFWMVPLAFVFSGAFAAIISPLVFRLRDAYFAISIWVIAEIVRLFIAQRDFFGSVSGLPLIATRGMDRGTVSMWTFYCAAIFAFLAVFGLYYLARLRFGLALASVRDNEGTAASIGINVWWTRFAGFVIGCGFTGAAGAVYYMSVFQVQPGGAFDPNWMVIMLFIVIIGGVGTVEGPIIGTAIYFFLRAMFSGTGNLYLLLLGAAAIAVMMVSSKGVWGVFRDRTGIDLFGARRISGLDTQKKG